MSKFSTLVLSLLCTCLYLRTSAQSNVQCNDNGTMADASDDFISFELNPTAPTSTFIDPYTYTVTALQGGNAVAVTLADGSPATSVPYGFVSPFRLGTGSAGGGNIVLTVTPDYGSAPPATLNLNDPGSCSAPGKCVPGQKTKIYTYRSPEVATDANDWQTYIPQFNPTAAQTLTDVSVVLNSTIANSYLLENMAVEPGGATTRYKVTLESYIGFKLAGSDIPLTNDLGQKINGTYNLHPSVAVPASGAWAGDINGSTLSRMMFDGWLKSRAFTYLNPTLDPRWVTNATGDPGTDADILKLLGSKNTVSNTVQYNSPADLANFIGTSNIPLTFSTLSGETIVGGGGNFLSANFTQAYFEVQTTYTYNQTCPPMPVKLESFKGVTNEGDIKLSWKVSEEANFDRYEVEHSTTPKNFKKIGTVPGNGGKSYEFVHEKPSLGDHYYRLKSVDLDGSFAYSSMIHLDMKGGQNSGIYPNPARSTELLNIAPELNGKIQKIEILSISGKTMKVYKAEDIQSGIRISSLNSGLYLVKFHMNDGQVETNKLIVTN